MGCAGSGASPVASTDEQAKQQLANTANAVRNAPSHTEVDAREGEGERGRGQEQPLPLACPVFEDGLHPPSAQLRLIATVPEQPLPLASPAPEAPLPPPTNQLWLAASTRDGDTVNDISGNSFGDLHGSATATSEIARLGSENIRENGDVASEVFNSQPVEPLVCESAPAKGDIVSSPRFTQNIPYTQTLASSAHVEEDVEFLDDDPEQLVDDVVFAEVETMMAGMERMLFGDSLEGPAATQPLSRVSSASCPRTGRTSAGMSQEDEQLMVAILEETKTPQRGLNSTGIRLVT